MTEIQDRKMMDKKTAETENAGHDKEGQKMPWVENARYDNSRHIVCHVL